MKIIVTGGAGFIGGNSYSITGKCQNTGDGS